MSKIRQVTSTNEIFEESFYLNVAIWTREIKIIMAGKFMERRQVQMRIG